MLLYKIFKNNCEIVNIYADTMYLMSLQHGFYYQDCIYTEAYIEGIEIDFNVCKQINEYYDNFIINAYKKFISDFNDSNYN